MASTVYETEISLVDMLRSSYTRHHLLVPWKTAGGFLSCRRPTSAQMACVPNLWGTPYVTISQLTRIDESLFNSPLLVQRVLYLSSFVQKKPISQSLVSDFNHHKSRHLSRQIKNVTRSTINNVTLSQISVYLFLFASSTFHSRLHAAPKACTSTA